MAGDDVEHDLPLSTRVIAALGVAILVGLWTYSYLRLRPSLQAADFSYPWIAARALIHGQNPYQAIKTSGAPFGPWLLYPLPAAILTIPFALLPMRVAAGAFVGLSSGLLAFAMTRRALWPLFVFVSAPASRTWDSVQGWSPLLLAASFAWPCLGVVCAKPNIALPLFLRQRSWRAVVGGSVSGLTILAISLAVQPRWPADWLNTIRGAPPMGQYTLPILHPMGFVLLLAVFRWRRPEARLLLAMACSPQNAFFYDQLPLMLIPRTRNELIVVALISQAAALVAPDQTANRVPYMIVGLYFPALVLVLTRRHGWDGHIRAPTESRSQATG